MDPVKVWAEPWDVNRRLLELDNGLTHDVLKQAVTRAHAAWAACTSHHPRAFSGIASWAEGIRTVRDLLVPLGWSSEDDRGQPLAVNPEGNLAITVLSGDEITGKVREGQPRTRAGHGPATVEFVDANQYLWPEMEADARARQEREFSRAKNTWVLLVYRDTELGQVCCELSHPTGMDEEGRIVSWSERIILPPVEFEPIPSTNAIDEGQDDGDISIDIKRRA